MQNAKCKMQNKTLPSDLRSATFPFRAGKLTKSVKCVTVGHNASPERRGGPLAVERFRVRNKPTTTTHTTRNGETDTAEPCPYCTSHITPSANKHTTNNRTILSIIIFTLISVKSFTFFIVKLLNNACKPL